MEQLKSRNVLVFIILVAIIFSVTIRNHLVQMLVFVMMNLVIIFKTILIFRQDAREGKKFIAVSILSLFLTGFLIILNFQPDVILRLAR